MTDLRAIEQDVRERRERMARQLRDDLQAVLKTPEGRRLWVWLQYEVCRLDGRAPDERRAVAFEMNDALRDQPELRLSVEEEVLQFRRTNAYYEAGLQRLRQEKASTKDIA